MTPKADESTTSAENAEEGDGGRAAGAPDALAAGVAERSESG